MKVATSDPFGWRDDFLVGYSPLDAMHQEFVGVVEALRAAPDHAIAQALEMVAHHLRDHFAAEDRWMLETNFPAWECHTNEHAAVLQSADAVQRRVAVGDYSAARHFTHALIEWFPGHADYLDASLAHWVIRQKYGGKPIVIRRHARGVAGDEGRRHLGEADAD